MGDHLVGDGNLVQEVDDGCWSAFQFRHCRPSLACRPTRPFRGMSSSSAPALEARGNTGPGTVLPFPSEAFEGGLSRPCVSPVNRPIGSSRAATPRSHAARLRHLNRAQAQCGSGSSGFCWASGGCRRRLRADRRCVAHRAGRTAPPTGSAWNHPQPKSRRERGRPLARAIKQSCEGFPEQTLDRARVGVQVPHGEGVANHIGPESCATIREDRREALTGECAGQAIEPRK